MLKMPCVGFITNGFGPIKTKSLGIIHPDAMFVLSYISFFICDDFIVLSPPSIEKIYAASCNNRLVLISPDSSRNITFLLFGPCVYTKESLVNKFTSSIVVTCT